MTRYEDNTITTIIQTNSSAAFDTIDVTALTDKFQYYGVEVNELKFFNTFLTDRQKYIQINTFTSDIEDSLPYSVVQGSKLSETLCTHTNKIIQLHKIMGIDQYKLITGH